MGVNKQHEISIGRVHFNEGYFLAKRIFDLFLGLVLLVAFSPFLLLVAALILILDGRPVFFTQYRTGKDGSLFKIWKFRSMKVHNSESDHLYSWKDGVPNQFVFKTNGNPQVTRLGAILRKYSLDELPQLFNVIKGDMSIVGPRPEIPAITNHYNREQNIRLFVKPGITGHAQIHGRADINHGEKIAYDLYYVKNCDFLFDLKIIAKTIIQVFTSKGSY